MEQEIRVGTFIDHKMFGLGKVVHMNKSCIFVVFRDSESLEASRFLSALRGLKVADVESDPILDNLPPVEIEDWDRCILSGPRPSPAN